MKKLLTLFLTVAILLTCSGCNKVPEQPVYDTPVHGETTLQEMIDSYKSVDPDALKSFIEQLGKYDQKNSDDKNARETIVKLYEDICAAYEQQQQQTVISEILSYTDVTDEEAAERAAQDSTNLLLLKNQGRSAIRDVLNGPYGKSLSNVIDPLQLHVYLDTIDYTPEMEEMEQSYSSMASDYHIAMSQPVSCEFNGQTYTSDEDLPEEHRKEISKLLWQSREEQIAPIYTGLINNRNEFAQLLGYDNYLDYCYACEYNRDYTSDDVKAMLDNIYELCAPLLISSINCIGDASLGKTVEMNGEEMLKMLDDKVGKVSPELKESLDYMLKYHLYSVGSEPERINGSLMEPIYSIRSGCIFANCSNTLSDYVTLIHEFGHFNNGYQVYSPALGNINNLDILETHSQGLELLMNETVNETASAEFGDYSASIIQRKMQVLLSAVMIARFEIECFEHPEMSAAEMREKMNHYASMSMAGAEEISDVIGVSSWTQIHHLFDAPLYYISYAISALSSMDVYSEYLKDPQTGWDKYTQLTHISPDMKYVEAVAACGLHDMTKEENIRQVMETLSSHYQDEFTDQMNEAVKKGKLEAFMDQVRDNVSYYLD